MADSTSLTLFHHLRGNCLIRQHEDAEIMTIHPNREQLVRRDALTGLEKETDSDNENENGNITDNVIIVPHLQVSTNELHLFNRAISSGGGLLADLQRATMAAQNFYEDIGSETNKRSPWVLKRLYEWSHRAKSREIVKHVEKAIQECNITVDVDEGTLKSYLEYSWYDIFPSLPKTLSEIEKKKFQAVWELFHSELIFLYKQLAVLKYVYKEPLKKCQVEGCLLTIEPELLFGNLDQIFKISQKFCQSFLSILPDVSKEIDNNDGEKIKEYDIATLIVQLFERFNKGPSTISAYQAYCINYKATIEYLTSIRQREERFLEFEKVCMGDSRCGRLQLEDLLICPLQRITRLPILLKEILKYTTKEDDRNKIEKVIEIMHESLRSIDDSVQWLHNFERIQQLQNQVVWPNIMELDNKSFIPEFLKTILSRQFCENLLAHPRRKLIHEGILTLVEAGGKLIESYAFLFNDMFLLTKLKKSNGKLVKRGSNVGTKQEVFIVQKQPVPLDSCVFCDADSAESQGGSSSLKNAFVVIHLTRYYQVVSVSTLQASSKEEKEFWINKFQESIENYECIQLKDMLKCTPLFSSINLRQSNIQKTSNDIYHKETDKTPNVSSQKTV
uniref:Pleckstrin homology domain-containing family G member 7 n=1 Tax=Strongyloides venezuelensis TaxID=75913 RepID=A0A0K0FW69_STRVS